MTSADDRFAEDAEAKESFDGAQEPSQPVVEPVETEVSTGSTTRSEEHVNMAGHSPTDLLGDLAQAEQDLAERTADLQRLQAEYVNYKRRVERDRDLVRENSIYAALSPMLPVLDDIDRAREHGELEGGFKAVADSLERIVAGLGLVKFGKPGDEFDPRMHEALMHAHSPDVTTTTCDAVVQAGYRIGDRVVRPARVTVVDPEPATASDDE